MIDIITVVFQKELYLLEVQARSIDLYIAPDQVKQIYVLVNDNTEVIQQINSAWWGRHQDKVVVLDRDRFGVDPTLDGWSSQQYYKLAVAAHSTAKWSMCLDTKTWFVQALDFNKLFDNNGRARFKCFPTIEVFIDAQNFVEKFFNIESKQVVGPGGVPFMFHSESIRKLPEYLEHQHQLSLFDFFRKHVKLPSLVTEFVLYSGWMKYLHGTLDLHYSHDQYYRPQNIADFERYMFDQLHPRMYDPECLTVSIHRSVYPFLTVEQKNQWVKFLEQKQLINEVETASLRLNIFNVE